MKYLLDKGKRLMPAVTRIGDADVTHCSGMTRAARFKSNVFVNGIGVSRQGDNEYYSPSTT